MIALPAGVQMWLAAGATDMRKGFDGLGGAVVDTARGIDWRRPERTFAPHLAV